MGCSVHLIVGEHNIDEVDLRWMLSEEEELKIRQEMEELRLIDEIKRLLTLIELRNSERFEEIRSSEPVNTEMADDACQQQCGGYRMNGNTTVSMGVSRSLAESKSLCRIGSRNMIQLERRRLQIWEFLADALVEPCFRSYIQWTGNGLEFQIMNTSVVFTELDQIRRNGVEMTTMVDPLMRWRNLFLDERIIRRNQIRMVRKRSGGSPNIIQSVASRYYFDDHIQICQRYEWDLNTLLNHIANPI